MLMTTAMTTFNRLRFMLFSTLGFVLGLVVCLPLTGLAQTLTGSSVTLQSGVPTAPSNVSAAYSGAFGQTPIYYWVIARFPAGATVPSAVAVANNTQGPQNLSAANTVTVTWNGISGATGYDVIRSSTPGFPAPGDTAVAINTASTSVTDSGAALSYYPPAGLVTIQPATATQSVDNLTNAVPQVTMVVNGTTLNLALISGTGTAGDCVQFAGDGSNRLQASGAPCGSGGGGGGFYQTVLNNGTPLSQRTQLNFIPGTGINISATDSAVPSRTSLTISTSLSQFYQTVLNNGVSLTQRDQLNIIPGTGISISNSDSASPSRTSITINATGGGGTGDVVGPASSTTNAIALFANGTGKLLADSAKLLPTGNIVGTGQSNTWTTGNQDFATATSLGIPITASAPTAAGHITFNPAASSHALRYGIGGGGGGGTRTVAIQGASSTNGNCAQYDSNGALTDTGSPCGGTALAPSITGTFAAAGASACTSTQTGQIAFLTDSSYQGRCSGTAWEWWWKGYKATLPWANGTWINQLTSTISNANGTTVLTLPATTSGDNLVMQVKNLPGSTYTLDMGFAISGNLNPSGGCGLFLRESSSGKIVRFAIDVIGGTQPVVSTTYWASATIFSASAAVIGAAGWATPAQGVYMRIKDDGVNRIYYTSQDGFTWGEFSRVSSGTFLAENQYGFGCGGTNLSNSSVSIIVFHLAVS